MNERNHHDGGSDHGPGAKGTSEPLVFEDESGTSELGSPGESRLSIRMEPRYEWGSAPAAGDPVMSVLLTLTPEGDPLAREDGPVAHVMLCVDISASMDHPDKYPVLTRALEGMVEDLQRTDGREVLLSLIVFAKGAKTIVRRVPVSHLDPRRVVEMIDESELRFGRYTDLVGALGRAGYLARADHRRDPTLPLRIYVLTDGKPQDVEGATEMMRRVGKLPVDVDAFAFGADSDIGLLRNLVCGQRGGTVKHLRKETLREAYQRVGEVAKRVVAKRALLSVELSPGVVGGTAYRFRPARHSYGQDAFAQGRSFETDLGTLETERSYSLLFQVRLPVTTDADTEIGRVCLRVPSWGGPREFRTTLAIPRHIDVKAIEADPVVVGARQVLEALDVETPEAQLSALRTRRKMYLAERRDPYLLEVIEKAIAALEKDGTLDALTSNERAALTAHTATAGSLRPIPTRREHTFG